MSFKLHPSEKIFKFIQFDLLVIQFDFQTFSIDFNMRKSTSLRFFLLDIFIGFFRIELEYNIE